MSTGGNEQTQAEQDWIQVNTSKHKQSMGEHK